MNDDLLGVVIAYATTKVTFSLLAFVPHRAYDPHTWKQKATKESRGLVSELAGAVGWYPYYLMRNCTFYGNVVMLSLEGADAFEGSKVSIDEERVIFYWQQNLAGEIPPTEVSQSADLNLRVNGHTIPFARKLRTVQGHFTVVWLLDEYGDLWLCDPHPQEIRPYRGAETELVDIEFEDDTFVFLTRTGQVTASYKRDVKARLLHSPATIVSIGFGERRIVATTTEGDLLYYSRPIKSFAHADNTPHLTTAITASLGTYDSIHPNYKQVHTTHVAFMDVERTVYYSRPLGGNRGYSHTPPEAIPLTKKRTQYLHQDYYSDPLYAIVDPA